MRIENRPPSSLTPYAENPRLNDDAVEAVAASIREFGFRQPIVADAEGVIIVGHTRWKAAMKLGLKRVPVHVAKDLTEEQARAYRIADNQTAAIADWDYDRLVKEIAGLGAGEIDLGVLGFAPDQLAALVDGGLVDGLTDPDEIPEPPDKPTTRPGDLYRLGPHRLLCGNASTAADVDRLVAGEEIHLVNTDPPYNVSVEPRTAAAIASAKGQRPALTHHQAFDLARGAGGKRGVKRKMRARDRQLENDFLPPAEFEALLLAWFGNMARVLAPGRAFYIWGGYANCANYPPALEACQLYFSQAIIWVKQHPVLTRKDFMGNHEWCFYGWRKGAGHFFAFGRNNVPDVWDLAIAPTPADVDTVELGPAGLTLRAPSGAELHLSPTAPAAARTVDLALGRRLVLQAGLTDVWRVKKINPQAMVHLTEKPVELALRAMQCSSRPGENVLDLFGGSGSTLIAAERAGRRAHLMELDPAYCDVIVQRWANFTGQAPAKAERPPAPRPRRKRPGRKPKAPAK